MLPDSPHTLTEKDGKVATKKSEGVTKKVKPKLIYLAAYDLKVRYQRIIQDIKYWEGLHSSNLLDKHKKQFEGIKKSIDSEGNVIKSETRSKGSAKSEEKPRKSITSVKKMVEQFETELTGELKLEELPAKLAFYKAQADRLAAIKVEDEPGFQVSWGHFRNAIGQRMVPQYRNFLEKVDVIARDCYYPLLKAVEALTGQNLAGRGWLAPMTVLEFAKFYRILSTREGPVPYIFVPFDRVDSIWNLCAIHHEVGHDLFHKLNYFPGLDVFQNQDSTTSLGNSSSQEERTPEYFQKSVKEYVEKRINELSLTDEEKVILRVIGAGNYLGWLEEIFADLIGVILAGPTYINSLQEILIDNHVIEVISNDYPPTYIRIFLNIKFAQDKLKCDYGLRDLKHRWESIFSMKELVQAVKDKLVKQQQDNAMFADFAIDLETNLNPDKVTVETTASSLNKWLPLLIDACWQAELAPNYNKAPINLCNIYAQIVRLERKSSRPKQKQNLPVYTDDLNRKYWQFIKKEIQAARERLTATNPERPNCRPRHLVAAVRLAFEDRVLQGDSDWEDELCRIFFDSINERPEVANEFEKLEQDFVERGWSYKYFYRDFAPNLSRYSRYLKQSR